MVPLLVSVAFGLGIYLLYEGLTGPRRPAATRNRLRPAEALLARLGLPAAPARDILLFSLGAALLGGLTLQLLLGWIVVSLFVAVLAAGIPVTIFFRREHRRRAARQVALVAAIAQLRDAVRTGLAVPEALAGLANNGPEPLREEFRTLTRELRLTGFEPAISAMRERVADPVFDLVAASLILNDRLGGRNLSQVLDRLAQATRDQLQTQDALRAYQARNILSARIVAAVPLVILFGIRKVNPDYLAVFDSWPGQLLLAGCLVSVVAGYVVMLWASRLPGERRVLA